MTVLTSASNIKKIIIILKNLRAQGPRSPNWASYLYEPHMGSFLCSNFITFWSMLLTDIKFCTVFRNYIIGYFKTWNLGPWGGRFKQHLVEALIYYLHSLRTYRQTSPLEELGLCLAKIKKWAATTTTFIVTWFPKLHPEIKVHTVTDQ